jgi:hypothetical protein
VVSLLTIIQILWLTLMKNEIKPLGAIFDVVYKAQGEDSREVRKGSTTGSAADENRSNLKIRGGVSEDVFLLPNQKLKRHLSESSNGLHSFGPRRESDRHRLCLIPQSVGNNAITFGDLIKLRGVKL